MCFFEYKKEYKYESKISTEISDIKNNKPCSQKKENG